MIEGRLSWLSLLLVLCVCALAACGGGGGDKSVPDEAADNEGVKETGEEISKNPIKALGQAASAFENMGKKMEEAANREPVDPVHFNDLLPFLPEPPSDWTAKEAEGSTTAMGEYKVTNVSRRYDLDKANVKIEITDGGYFPAVYASYTMMSAFSQETTQGHSKGVTVDGHSGFEVWKKKPMTTDLTMLVADRYLVKLTARGMPLEDVRKWTAGIDLDKLAGL